MTEENDKTLEDREPESTEGGALTFTSIVMSTLAAAIGVQSKANKERDFKHGSAGPFIVAGLIFTALFVGTLVLIVRWVLSNATG